MAKCSYCDVVMPKGTGVTFVKNDGKIFYLCSSKCDRNLFKLGRKPAKWKWTGKYQKGKSVEAAK